MLIIYCKNCGYEMTYSEASGHLSLKIVLFFFKIICALYFTNRIHSKNGGGYRDGVFISALNMAKVPCHECMKEGVWGGRKIIEESSGK